MAVVNDGTSGYESMKAFKFWCQKVLPLVYDDSLSYYEVLDKLVQYINKMIENEDALDTVNSTQNKKIQELQKVVDTLTEEMNKVKSGGYNELYTGALTDWLDSNMPQLIGRTVKYVNFGLSDDGHFMAYIPNSWEFLTFDTIMDYGSPMYGHLVMRY